MFPYSLPRTLFFLVHLVGTFWIESLPKEVQEMNLDAIAFYFMLAIVGLIVFTVELVLFWRNDAL